MKKRTALDEWAATVAEKMTVLSKPQAMLLALWSFGIVVTQSSGTTSVSVFLAALLDVKENSMRQRLREWYKEKQAKCGSKRSEVEVTDCFVPLIQWALEWWSCEEQRLALAMDASSLGQRFVVLCVSIVFRGCAIPVAWVVLPEGKQGKWRPHWQALFAHVHGSIPETWTVIVLADRGLYARWLFVAIQANGWHPFLRVNHAYGTYCKQGESQFLPLKIALPGPGRHWSGRVRCFKSKPLDCTLLACWGEEHCDPWLILTDLSPHQADVLWYRLRFWIECGFKQTKRAGWQWQRTRMTDPERASRLWLAIAVATLWAVSFGGDAEDNLPPSSFEALPLTHIAHSHSFTGTRSRTISSFRRGLLTLIAHLIAGRPLPLPTFKPAPWPVSQLLYDSLDHPT